jgi:hypothetical protein
VKIGTLRYVPVQTPAMAGTSLKPDHRSYVSPKCNCAPYHLQQRNLPTCRPAGRSGRQWVAECSRCIDVMEFQIILCWRIICLINIIACGIREPLSSSEISRCNRLGAFCPRGGKLKPLPLSPPRDVRCPHARRGSRFAASPKRQ